MIDKEEANEIIKDFSEEFGEAHLQFAFHAAFPLILNPDLLYHIWANFRWDLFGNHLNVPWYAVADVLLSSLCMEVAHETYSMKENIRGQLLMTLASHPQFVNTGHTRIEELGHFLESYVRRDLNSPRISVREQAQAQRWNAFVFLQPERLTEEIRKAYSDIQEKPDEHLRIANLLQTFNIPLSTWAKPDPEILGNFQELLAYSQGWTHYLQKQRTASDAYFDYYLKSSLEETILSIPDEVIERIRPKSEDTSEKIDVNVGDQQATDRRSALSRLREKASDQNQALSPDTYYQASWDALYQRIQDGKVVPIVGDLVRKNSIFNADKSNNIQGVNAQGDRLYEFLDKEASDHLSVNEELAELWAHKIGYPLPDLLSIPRVAKFNRVMSNDTRQAKSNYLLFLKECLLNVAEEDESVATVIQGLRSQLFEKSFSQMVAELDYPYFPPNRHDPLRVLARLRLPIYVTTSYYDFMERALIVEGASDVRTRFCLWNMEPESVKHEHLPDASFIPSREEPVVYHLYGYEEYPRSLVLSEDDYLDFLLALAQDTNAYRPLIPFYLRTALEECSLLLLGYRMQDWDFRILYRGLINLQHPQPRMLDRTYSIAIQPDPKYQEGIADKENARRYLNQYFRTSNFEVHWSSIQRFSNELLDRFNKPNA